MREFAEMCFDPQSPANDRLKQMLFEMLGEAQHEYKRDEKGGAPPIMFSDIHIKIASGDAPVSITGLGYVGLLLAVITGIR